MKPKQLLKAILSQINRRKIAPSAEENPPWRERYEVGRGTYGEPEILHWGEPTTLKVGSFCSIAVDVKIFLGGNHRYDWITTYPFSVFWQSAKHISGHPASRGDVIIGHDVWIGAYAVILSGVQIGNGAVIGAASVITKDVPPYAIVAGNPAKVIGSRFSEEDVCILQSIQWWSWDEDKLNAAMPFLLNGYVSALQVFSSDYELASDKSAAANGNSAMIQRRI